LALGPWSSWAWIGAFLGLVALWALNMDLYRFFAREGGTRFAVGAIGLHALYFLYSSLVFGVVLTWYGLQKHRHRNQYRQPNVRVESTPSPPNSLPQR